MAVVICKRCLTSFDAPNRRRCYCEGCRKIRTKELRDKHEMIRAADPVRREKRRKSSNSWRARRRAGEAAFFRQPTTLTCHTAGCGGTFEATNVKLAKYCRKCIRLRALEARKRYNKTLRAVEKRKQCYASLKSDPVRYVRFAERKRHRRNGPENWMSNAIAQARLRAKRAGLPFELDNPDVRSDLMRRVRLMACELSGVPLRFGKGRNVFSPSLDRSFDPERGYAGDNTKIVAMCLNVALNNHNRVDVTRVVIEYAKRHHPDLLNNASSNPSNG